MDEASNQCLQALASPTPQDRPSLRSKILTPHTHDADAYRLANDTKGTADAIDEADIPAARIAWKAGWKAADHAWVVEQTALLPVRKASPDLLAFAKVYVAELEGQLSALGWRSPAAYFEACQSTEPYPLAIRRHRQGRREGNVSHTPLPWVRHGPRGLHITGSDYPRPAFADGVCEVDDDDRQPAGTAEANAALIAKSPELLDMVRGLLCCCELNRDDMEEDTRSTINAAVALLAEIDTA